MTKGRRQMMAEWVPAFPWLLTAPFGAIVAATAFIIPCIIIEKRYSGDKTAVKEKLTTNIYWFGSFHSRRQSSPNAVSSFLFPLILVHHWCQFFQEDVFNRQIPAVVCIHHFL